MFGVDLTRERFYPDSKTKHERVKAIEDICKGVIVIIHCGI